MTGRVRAAGWIASCLLLCSLLALPSLGAASNTAKEISIGVMLLQVGRAREGLFRLNQALGSDASLPAGHAALGAARLLCHDPAEAQARFRQALALDRGCLSARLGLALCRLQEGNVEAALTEYKQALAFNGPEQDSIRAGYAYLCCLTGMYAAASAECEPLLRGERGNALARQTYAAALLAQQRPSEAWQVLSPAPDGASRVQLLGRWPVRTESPLLSLRAAYRRTHAGDQRERFTWPPPGSFLARRRTENATANAPPPIAPLMEPEWIAAPVSPTTSGAAGVRPAVARGGLRITSPAHGALLSGVVEVGVATDSEARIDYVVLTVDGGFKSLTNTRPFRLMFDAAMLEPGPHVLRAAGYSPGGTVVATAETRVQVAVQKPTPATRRHRTFDPAAKLWLDRAERDLERLLVLRADPLAETQLRGRVQEARGRMLAAAEAYERVFSAQPYYPGIRTDLLWSYHQLGWLTADGAAQEIRSLPRQDRCVALTFDDGPHPVLTPRILKTLDRYGWRATFFLVGKQVELYPDLAREIAKRGHEIGAHSYTHSDLSRMTQREVERELVKSRAVIREATGVTVRLFRPPGGHYNDRVRQALQATGFSVVFWNSNIGCYQHVPSEEAARKIVRQVSPSGIVLLHNGEDATERVLPELLAELQQNGYVADTVSSLCRLSP